MLCMFSHNLTQKIPEKSSFIHKRKADFFGKLFFNFFYLKLFFHKKIDFFYRNKRWFCWNFFHYRSSYEKIATFQIKNGLGKDFLLMVFITSIYFGKIINIEPNLNLSHSPLNCQTSLFLANRLYRFIAFNCSIL